MIANLEAYLASWLGNASAIGALSWLHAFTWIAALIAVVFAGVSLRRQSLQSRATLLLNLYKSWDDLSDKRRAFADFFYKTRHEAMAKHSGLQNKHQIVHIKRAFDETLTKMRNDKDPKFSDYVEFLAFFEVLGMYVRNGYVPVRDVAQLFEGPIINLDTVWRDHIVAWQQEAHMAPGLFENALMLMDVVRIKTEHPIYYRTAYRIRKIFR